ncbi:MAG: tRNA (adenosine(37)-N6)-dimethylallyltransferase MiaA [Kocuria sp.]|nr:tRNA (adenosine(37)-N6)-dimethylallyltransferase MiaA [Kocuria sp.]
MAVFSWPAHGAPLIAVVGPTGTGKSDLALALAEHLEGEVINGDALQFYRGMDIGTAKLSVAERRGVPHHLLDIMDISEEASVARFQTDARAAIDDVAGRGKVPILAGGSGLYVRAAVDAIEFPGTDPAVRARLENELAEQGRGELLARLNDVDPQSAERVKDDRRLVRALEVYEVTGRPFTSFMPQREYVRPTIQFGLDMNRELLNQRLAQRIDGMLSAGWLDEVRQLERRGLRESPTAGKALGYPQLLDVLAGERTLEAAREDTVVATRRFTKRQRTWFHADPRVHWLDAGHPGGVDALARDAVRMIEAA